MNDIFTPFTPSPTIAPADEKPVKAAKTAKIKPPKRKRKVKAVNNVPEQSPEAPPPARKKRKARTVPAVRTPRSMKLPVSTMLQALAELKAADSALFEKLLGLLNGAGRSQRQRVLGALGRVLG